MKKLKISVMKESKTGRNEIFNVNGKKLSRVETVKIIKKNPGSNYFVAKINGKDTPKSKPDGFKKNNLG